MNMTELQTRLAARGSYKGLIDGRYGRLSRDAVMLAMTDGPDTPLSTVDIEAAAKELGVTPAHVQTVIEVESSGDPFADGRPTILFEPHRFSKATGGRFDKGHPTVSYPVWDPTKYPRSQAGRYAQLLQAIPLHVDAAFASASWGAFQVLGENYAVCGYESTYEFAVAQAYDECHQLEAFVRFVKARGLDEALRAGAWARFAKGYNGTAYVKNRYDVRLAQAFRKISVAQA